MNPLLFTALAAYVVAAIHSHIAFVNKRKAIADISLYALAIGFVIHTIALISEWISDGRYPLYGMRETLSFLAWTLVGTFAITLFRYRTLALGSFITPVVVLLTSAAMLFRSVSVSPDLAQLSSRWLAVHTTLWIFAYSALFVVFAASIMFLLQERELKHKTFGSLFHRLPSLMTVNDIATTAAAIGFSLLTIGIFSGMLLSWSRTHRIWQNDPKEILAGLTWLVYFVLILYRMTEKWRGTRAAWLGVVGFGLVICTFLGARLMGGYHLFG
jgi:ABC-type uncharacterized transport system permease subunit